MLSLTFLEAKIGALRKTVTDQGIQSYPNAAQFKSHTEAVASPKQFLEALKKHSDRGHCLHVGDLIAPLTEWGRRAGMVNKTAPIQWLVLDIDKLNGSVLQTPITGHILADAAEAILTSINCPDMHNVSYIAQASTKLGLIPGQISMHIFFMLEDPILTIHIKQWLRWLNLQSDLLRKNIALSKNGHNLTYALDVTCADPAKLIYIATPEFVNVSDPFQSPDHRLVLVEKEKPALPTEHITKITSATVGKGEVKLKAELRELEGYNPRERENIRTIQNANGEPIDLLLNPAPGKLEHAHSARGYIYYNYNGGDSAAYFHPEGLPDIIYNFKGEPAFRFADVDPEGYAQYCEANADTIAAKTPINAFMVINQNDDVIYKVWHDRLNHRIMVTPSSRDRVEDFYAEHGGIPPAFLPTWRIEYDPQNPRQVDYVAQTINRFEPSPYMKDAGDYQIDHNLLRYENAAVIAQYCPNIWFLLNHVAGNGEEEVTHFINWFATVFQCRRKTETGWLFQGVHGTGKGTLYEKIIVPVLGEQNCSMRNNDALNDVFDAWRANKLLIAFDEFKIKSGASSETVVAKLRNWMSEERTGIRAMHKESRDTALYENYIFFSNHHDATPIPETDRRFNICPRQEIPLKNICDTDALYNGIDNEIDLFAYMIANWQLREEVARLTLTNKAKEVARRAAFTYAEEFCSALHEGSLDFLIAGFEIQRPNEPHAILRYQHAKNAIVQIAEAFPNEVFIPSADIADLYNTMFDSRLSVGAISKMLSRQGLNSIRTRHNNVQTRGYLLKFTKCSLTEHELKQLIAQQTTLQVVGAE